MNNNSNNEPEGVEDELTVETWEGNTLRVQVPTAIRRSGTFDDLVEFVKAETNLKNPCLVHGRNNSLVLLDNTSNIQSLRGTIFLYSEKTLGRLGNAVERENTYRQSAQAADAQVPSVNYVKTEYVHQSPLTNVVRAAGGVDDEEKAPRSVKKEFPWPKLSLSTSNVIHILFLSYLICVQLYWLLF